MWLGFSGVGGSGVVQQGTRALTCMTSRKPPRPFPFRSPQVALLQATTVKSKAKAGGGAGAPPAGSTLQQVKQIVAEHGWAGLFPGLHAALVGTTVSQGVYFTLYSALRQAAAGEGPDASLTVPQSLAVAALAGAGNVMVTNPIWVVATRLQSHRRVSKTAPGKAEGEGKAGGEGEEDVAVEQPEVVPTHAPSALAIIREVLHEYGPLGFWNGCSASLVMVINPTLQYSLYEWLLRVRARTRGPAAPRRPSAGEVFLLSALAKAGATVMTYPMLTVKTRMMTARRGDAHLQYTSVGDAVCKIYRAEGVAGYYQGLQSKLVQSVLAAALLFMAKEEITTFTRRLLLRRPAKAIA